ncbi:MAG: ROK family protein [Candidatus Marinimicrobia bacterium]|nr:ROK family protein [Candidatus Neomarinimicrobiota bacterium]
MINIGVDIGGTRTKIGLVQDGILVQKVIIESSDHDNFQKNLENIDQTIRQFSIAEIGTVGFAFPGIVDMNSKKVLSTPQKYEDAVNIDLEAWTKERFKAKFVIDNDARAALIGEKFFGIAQSTDNFVIITLGTGLGTSVMINGKVLYGKHFQAGCLGGHMSVKYNGNPCKCGNIGCAESEASTLMLENYIKGNSSFQESKLSEVSVLDFYHLIQCVKEKDGLAQEILDHFIRVWSTLAINLIHAYDPDLIVFFGGIMKSHEFILPKMKEIIDQQAWTPWGKVKLAKSSLGDDAGMLGITSDFYTDKDKRLFL